MGQWSMHIEGGGIHDNGRPDDADAMLKAFAEDLAQHHTVNSVTFTVGQTRELVNPSALDAADPAYDGTAQAHERAYRYRTH